MNCLKRLHDALPSILVSDSCNANRQLINRYPAGGRLDGMFWERGSAQSNFAANISAADWLMNYTQVTFTWVRNHYGFREFEASGAAAWSWPDIEEMLCVAT